MDALVQLLGEWGCAGLLLLAGIAVVAFIIVGGFRGWYVWGWQHRDLLAQERARTVFWRGHAMLGTHQAEQALGIVEKADA